MTWLARAFVLVSFALNGAAAAPADPPPDLAKWGLYCFCISAIRTPQRVVLADNNGAILYRLRDPATLDAVRKGGVEVSDSQILLLKTFGLVREQADGTLLTAMSIFGPDVIGPVRDRVKAIATRIAPQIVSDAKAIGEMMSARGYGESAYAVVFGHGLDGVMWNMLGDRGVLPGTGLDRDHPLWAGAFWAAYPERTGVPGTNAAVRDNATITQVWTDAVLAGVTAAAAAPDILAAASAAAQGNAANSPVPLIYEGDPADLAAKRIAAVVADALLEDPELQQIIAALPAQRDEATLVVAHEFVWDLLGELAASGAVAAPSALTGNPDPAALRALIFIAVKPKA